MDRQPGFEIKRKPVGFKGQDWPTAPSAAVTKAVDAEPPGESSSRPLQLPSKPNPLQISDCEDAKGKRLGNVVASPNVTNQHAELATSDLPSVCKDPPPYETTTLVTAEIQEAPTLTVESRAEGSSSFFKTAFDEARYFAGSLIPRPHESTKHYTILRHSSSIIFYRGPATSVVITIFSSSEPNTPLPADRTIWLQQRGYSGDTGMRLKRLVGATGNWLDVTPTTLVPEQDVDTSDERGWKRDIARFMKKHSQQKMGRAPRETLVIRLPTLVEDGYFRLVLCTGGKHSAQDNTSSRKRKVLCSSPVFRVASTSIDPSILKGASIKTLPLEFGVMVGSTIGMGKFRAVLSPVTTKVQNQLQALQPDNYHATRVATTAYQVSGVHGKVSAAEAQFNEAREATTSDVFGKIDEGTNIELDVVGSDDGPDSLYPIKFVGNVVPGTGGRRSIPGVPTANLGGVPEDTKLRLKGTYLGWACVVPTKDTSGDIPQNWYEAVISAGPSRAGTATVVAKHAITVHLIYDFGSCTFFDAKLAVIVMGFLRPMEVTEAADTALVERDIQVTLSSLSRANWGAQVTLQKMKDAKESRTFSDKYVQARQQMQRRADSLPLHLAGVRAAGAEARDRVAGNGGYWIARSS